MKKKIRAPKKQRKGSALSAISHNSKIVQLHRQQLAKAFQRQKQSKMADVSPRASEDRTYLLPRGATLGLWRLLLAFHFESVHAAFQPCRVSGQEPGNMGKVEGAKVSSKPNVGF